MIKMKKLITIIILTIIGLNANAQWQLSGLTSSQSGVVIWCILVDGTNMYAGTQNGVFLSSDNGATWTPKNNGITNNTIWSLAKFGTKIFAGTDGAGIFVSSNNGTSWTTANNGLNANARISTIVANGTNLFAGDYMNGAFLSTNSGSSWTGVNTGFPSPQYLNVLAFNGSNLFACSNGFYMWRSTNNGSSWTHLTNGFVGDSYMESIGFIGSNIFVGGSTSIFLSSDNGSNWSNVSSGLPVGTHNWAFAISGTTIFVAKDNGKGVYQSVNNGGLWTAVNDGFPISSSFAVKSLIIDGSFIYAGTSSGLYKRPVSEMMGISENGINNSFEVYPNPVHSSFTLNGLPDDVDIIEVFDMLGKKIYTINGNEKQTTYQLNIVFAPCGIYYVKISTKEKNFIEKIMKL
jgi:photosystem II stability/assembly factor-like uncharacterized protein